MGLQKKMARANVRRVASAMESAPTANVPPNAHALFARPATVAHLCKHWPMSDAHLVSPSAVLQSPSMARKAGNASTLRVLSTRAVAAPSLITLTILLAALSIAQRYLESRPWIAYRVDAWSPLASMDGLSHQLLTDVSPMKNKRKTYST